MTNLIDVYPAEVKAGLQHRIESEASVAFMMEAANTVDKVIAGLNAEIPEAISTAVAKKVGADANIHSVYSILVSTVWNKNDDIFLPGPVWAARDTPTYKPSNLGHDETKIVGSIIDTWAVDDELKLIADISETQADESFQLPELFHLLVASVIYKRWSDPELVARVDSLIESITAGEMFVSMECLFNNFDYGVIDTSGDNHIVARSADTAFLTQHLRAYGGKGTYQDHKVGRVLRDITFSAVGYVENPANPASIIFDAKHIFSFANVCTAESLLLNENGVNNNTDDKSFESNQNEENDIMTTDLLNDQVKELKESMAALKTENKELADKLSTANVSQYEEKISTLEASVSELEESYSGIESELNAANIKVEALEADLTSKSTELTEVQSNFDKMKEDEKKKKRHASLVEAGLSVEDAEAKLEVFASLSDEQFDVVVKTVSESKAPETSEAADEADESDEDDAEDTDAAEIVDEVEDEAEVSIASEDTDGEDELSTARAGLQNWIEQTVMKK